LGINKSVIVIGGGISGLAAALTLVRNGIKIILIEKKTNLGGRAFSFNHLKLSEKIDNGQHIFTKSCTEYIKFLENIGASDNTIIEKSVRVPVYKKGKRSDLKFSHNFLYLSLIWGLLRYTHISFLSKLRIFYALAYIKLKKNTLNLDSIDFKTWLRNHYQNNETQKYFWELILKPSLNDELSSMSSYAAIMIIKNSILKPGKSAFGLPKVDLTSLVESNMKKVLKETNSKLITGVYVKRLTEEKDMIQSIDLSNNNKLEVGLIISAVPFYELNHLMKNSKNMLSILTKTSQLESAPIVCIHLWLSEKVTDEYYFTVLDSPVQWVFNVSKIRESNSQNNQHLVISLSSAWKWVGYDREKMISLFSKEIFKLLKISSKVKIKQTLVVNQPNATFRSCPGSIDLRPENVTPLKNFFLAGDWTNTGWPSTMESAVRSGINSANESLKYLKSIENANL